MGLTSSMDIDLSEYPTGIIPEQFVGSLTRDTAFGAGDFVEESFEETLDVGAPAPITLQSGYSFEAGWNMMSWVLPFEQKVSDAFNNLAVELGKSDAFEAGLQLIKNNDADVFWPEYGFNGIGNFIPGQGYQVKLTGDSAFIGHGSNWTIPESEQLLISDRGQLLQRLNNTTIDLAQRWNMIGTLRTTNLDIVEAFSNCSFFGFPEIDSDLELPGTVRYTPGLNEIYGDHISEYFNVNENIKFSPGGESNIFAISPDGKTGSLSTRFNDIDLPESIIPMHYFNTHTFVVGETGFIFNWNPHAIPPSPGAYIPTGSKVIINLIPNAYQDPIDMFPVGTNVYADINTLNIRLRGKVTAISSSFLGPNTPQRSLIVQKSETFNLPDAQKFMNMSELPWNEIAGDDVSADAFTDEHYTNIYRYTPRKDFESSIREADIRLITTNAIPGFGASFTGEKALEQFVPEGDIRITIPGFDSFVEQVDVVYPKQIFSNNGGIQINRANLKLKASLPIPEESVRTQMDGDRITLYAGPAGESTVTGTNTRFNSNNSSGVQILSGNSVFSKFLFEYNDEIFICPKITQIVTNTYMRVVTPELPSNPWVQMGMPLSYLSSQPTKFYYAGATGGGNPVSGFTHFIALNGANYELIPIGQTILIDFGGDTGLQEAEVTGYIDRAVGIGLEIISDPSWPNIFDATWYAKVYRTTNFFAPSLIVNTIQIEKPYSAGIFSGVYTGTYDTNLYFSESMQTNQNIIPYLVLVKNYEGDAYFPEFDFNGIGEMEPGEGYQVSLQKAFNQFRFPTASINIKPLIDR